jgi:hypothetical protein
MVDFLTSIDQTGGVSTQARKQRSSFAMSQVTEEAAQMTQEDFVINTTRRKNTTKYGTAQTALELFQNSCGLQ